MRCHLRKWYLRNGRFSPSSSKFVRPCGTPRFPFGFRQKISVRRNFLPEKRSESAGTDVRGIQKAKTATDVVHVRQGKELSRAPFHAVPRHETAFLSGCGEGSPAPSALHMRVVLPISTSAGIACPFLRRNGLPQQAAWHRLFRIWRNIPEKRVEDGLLFGCITTKLYFCKK